MKTIFAIIQPAKLDPVREALAQIGVERMTVLDAHGYGRQLGQTAMFRGVEYEMNLLRKIQIMIVVNDDFLDRTLDTLESVGRTGREGEIGDGKVFVLPTVETYQIGGTERGPSAV